ncbi:hypothetical protein AcV5_008052 [Taiwanofungus camphoratus]|nr:hypothetical protein AcV5_008052 [Antrodia cinnamomea]KAI0930827.1 hypothetical protein AcV7_004907 [Antrodia cinnamomea]
MHQQMAAVLTRVQRGCRLPHTAIISRPVYLKRSIHQTAIALKRKQTGSKATDGDLFGSDESGETVLSDDLFDSNDARTTTNMTAASGSGTSSGAVKTSRRLNAEERSTRFEELRKFVADRIGQRPIAKVPQVRNAAWQHLVGLATTKEQLEQVVEMFPRWRDSKRRFDQKHAEAFVRRCEELHCPTLALKVFSDHPKYGFDLCSQTAARRLLHSLHVEHPLQDSITLAALFRIYNLPPISSDLVSCAMLTSACFKHGTRQSLAIAHEMVPHLKGLLEKVEPQTMQLSRESMERAKNTEKEKTWLAWTLTKIEKALQKEGSDCSWLSQWRKDSGHAQLAM